MRVVDLFVAFPLECLVWLQYELEMVATDSVNEASTQVIIKINDVNDRPPVFDQNSYVAELEEEFTVGLPLQLLKVGHSRRLLLATLHRLASVHCVACCIMFTEQSCIIFVVLWHLVTMAKDIQHSLLQIILHKYIVFTYIKFVSAGTLDICTDVKSDASQNLFLGY